MLLQTLLYGKTLLCLLCCQLTLSPEDSEEGILHSVSALCFKAGDLCQVCTEAWHSLRVSEFYSNGNIYATVKWNVITKLSKFLFQYILYPSPWCLSFPVWFLTIFLYWRTFLSFTRYRKCKSYCAIFISNTQSTNIYYPFLQICSRWENSGSRAEWGGTRDQTAVRERKKWVLSCTLINSQWLFCWLFVSLSWI